MKKVLLGILFLCLTVTMISCNKKANEDVIKGQPATNVNFTYSILWDADGGEMPAEYSTTYVEGEGLCTLPRPTKEGYDFLGWYENTTKVDEISASEKGIKELKAQWHKIEIISAILWDADGGEMPAEHPTTYVEEVGLSNLPTPTKEGYRFLGWYENTTKVDEISASEKGIKELKAQWQKLKIWEKYGIISKIVWDVDGGVMPAEYPTTYVEGIGLCTLPRPTKEDDNFLGWSDGKNLRNCITLLDSGTIKLTALWGSSTRSKPLPLVSQALIYFNELDQMSYSKVPCLSGGSFSTLTCYNIIMRLRFVSKKTDSPVSFYEYTNATGSTISGVYCLYEVEIAELYSFNPEYDGYDSVSISENQNDNVNSIEDIKSKLYIAIHTNMTEECIKYDEIIMRTNVRLETYFTFDGQVNTFEALKIPLGGILGVIENKTTPKSNVFFYNYFPVKD